VQETAPVRLDVKNLAGVKVPLITRIPVEQEHQRYWSLMLQDVGDAYLLVIESIMHIAATETALRKVLIEIRKTKQRAYALEHVVIPELEYSRTRIQSALEERAREEFARLKHRKVSVL